MDCDGIANNFLDKGLHDVGSESPVPITCTIAQGHPAKVPADASTGADPLVVGSRGHGGFVGMLLGSVSEYVIGHAHCPLLVDRHRRTD